MRILAENSKLRSEVIGLKISRKLEYLFLSASSIKHNL